MSLFLNLVNYSSTLQSQYRLSLPKDEGKDERSRSLHMGKLDALNQRPIMSSRSLSKLFSEKPESNLNPKTRILHRIHHMLSIKCKKHYYAFFVTLETLKKKNLSLTSQGQLIQFEKKKIQPINLQNTSKVTKQEEKQIVIQKFVKKVEEIQKIILFKQFQQRSKVQFFNSIKNHFLYHDKLGKLIEKAEILQKKLSKYQALRKLKKVNHFCFKLQILSNLIDSLNKKYAKKKKQLLIKEKREFFDKVRLISKEKEMQSKIFQSQAQKINTQSDKMMPDLPNLQTQKIISVQEIKEQTEKINEINTDKSSGDKQIIIRSNPPLQTLEIKLVHSEKRKFQRNQLNMMKSLFVKTQTDQKPMIIQKELHNDQRSHFCKNLPKNYIRMCDNDPHQESTIFLKENSSILPLNSKLSLPNITKGSKVAPFRNKKSTSIIESNIKSMKKTDDFNLQEISNFSISDVSEVSMLKTQKSINTLNNDKSFNFSATLTDAVDFKNSLIRERESLKETDKNFMKKHSNNLPSQINISTIGFLKSTLDPKTNKKNQEQLITDRAFSNDKVSQISGKTFNVENDFTPISTSYWTRPSSPLSRQGPKRNERQTQKQHIIISNSNSFLYQNQNIFPTRDSSGLNRIQDSGRKTQNQARQFVSEKNSKQKSFIRLTCKAPFIKKSK